MKEMKKVKRYIAKYTRAKLSNCPMFMRKIIKLDKIPMIVEAVANRFIVTITLVFIQASNSCLCISEYNR